MDSGDSPVSDTAALRKDIKECINDIEKHGLDWVQARADARDKIFKEKSKKIIQGLNKSQESLIRLVREKVEHDRALKDADIEQKLLF